jgi:hypothetical protein
VEKGFQSLVIESVSDFALNSFHLGIFRRDVNFWGISGENIGQIPRKNVGKLECE